MIAISTVLFDLDGNFIFYDKDLNTDQSKTDEATRRTSKVQTLDGGVFVDDSGYSVGDSDIKVSVKSPTKALYKKLLNVFKYHRAVVVVTENNNVTLCVPQSIRLAGGNALMQFLTKESA